MQNISNNTHGDSGSVMSIHTRSLKYGKLENGVLLQVPSNTVPRLPQHYISLPVVSVSAEGSSAVNYLDLILGKNGFIWITSEYIYPMYIPVYVYVYICIYVYIWCAVP